MSDTCRNTIVPFESAQPRYKPNAAAKVSENEPHNVSIGVERENTEVQQHQVGRVSIGCPLSSPSTTISTSTFTSDILELPFTFPSPSLCVIDFVTLLDEIKGGGGTT